MKNADLPAMPTSTNGNDPEWAAAVTGGLTKREMFAMGAMQGLCAHSGDYHGYSDLACDAVAYADALLFELEV